MSALDETQGVDLPDIVVEPKPLTFSKMEGSPFWVSELTLPNVDMPAYVVRQNANGHWLAIAEDEGYVLLRSDSFEAAARACTFDHLLWGVPSAS